METASKVLAPFLWVAVGANSFLIATGSESWLATLALLVGGYCVWAAFALTTVMIRGGDVVAGAETAKWFLAPFMLLAVLDGLQAGGGTASGALWLSMAGFMAGATVGVEKIPGADLVALGRANERKSGRSR